MTEVLIDWLRAEQQILVDSDIESIKLLWVLSIRKRAPVTVTGKIL